MKYNFKKKLLLTLSLALLLACIFAVCIRAEAYDPHFGEVEYIDDIGVTAKDVIYKYVEGQSELARIKVSCTCEKGEHTYPTYYFMSINVHLATLFNKDYARMNEKNPCGATYDKDSIIAVEMPEGICDFYGTQKPESGTFMNHYNLEYIKFPSTFSSISILGFKNCSKLQWADMSLVTKMTSLGLSTFNGCTSLKGICLPDGIKDIGNAAFIGCYELGAVYLPASLETVDTHSTWPMFHPKDGNATATAPFCAKMYFVNEKFDNPDNVEKPSVYYMPQNLKNIWAHGFRGMESINDVIVFGEKFTNFNQSTGLTLLNLGEGERFTLVFRGDMTGFSYVNSISGVDVYFVNLNDTSPDGIGFSGSGSGTGDARFYVCNGETSRLFSESEWTSENYVHFGDLRTGALVPADCYFGERVSGVLCYCGAKAPDVVVEGSVGLGHILGGGTYYEFTSFTVAGSICVDCTRQGCEYAEKSPLDAPIFVSLGYSFNQFSDGEKCFVNGYKINDDMLRLYEETMGVAVGYGVAFNAASTLAADENGEITLDCFVLKGYAKRAESAARFGAVEYKVTYENNERLEENLDKEIVIAVFVSLVDENGEETVSFVNQGNGDYYGFESVSYNSVERQSKAKQG